MDFAPRFTFVPGPKSTYTLVRKTKATSSLGLPNRVFTAKVNSQIGRTREVLTPWQCYVCQKET
jgi:hypothetical protein